MRDRTRSSSGKNFARLDFNGKPVPRVPIDTRVYSFFVCQRILVQVFHVPFELSLHTVGVRSLRCLTLRYQWGVCGLKSSGFPLVLRKFGLVRIWFLSASFWCFRMAEWSEDESNAKRRSESFDIGAKLGELSTHHHNGVSASASGSYQKKLQLPQSRWETFQRIRQNRHTRLAGKCFVWLEFVE